MNIKDCEAIAGILRKEHQQSTLFVQPGHGHAINAVTHLVDALADYMEADASEHAKYRVMLGLTPKFQFDRAKFLAACYGSG